jgi:hypothetical protein
MIYFLIYLASGVYAMCLHYTRTQIEFPIVAFEQRKDDILASIVIGLLGPFGLLATMYTTRGTFKPEWPFGEAALKRSIDRSTVITPEIGSKVVCLCDFELDDEKFSKDQVIVVNQANRYFLSYAMGYLVEYKDGKTSTSAVN